MKIQVLNDIQLESSNGSKINISEKKSGNGFEVSYFGEKWFFVDGYVLKENKTEWKLIDEDSVKKKIIPVGDKLEIPLTKKI